MTDDEMKTLRVSTEAFHNDGGLDAFREIFGREILGIEIDPLEGHPLAIDLTLRSLPGFAMASGTLSPMRNRHTPALLDNDDVVLVVMQSGVGEVNQYGRVAMVNEGEAVLTANGAEATFTGLTSTRVDQFTAQPKPAGAACCRYRCLDRAADCEKQPCPEAHGGLRHDAQ